MVFLLISWIILCFFSFGAPAFIFFSMKKVATRPWQIKIDKSYRPKVSILVPTYNESSVIRFKLKNLNKIDYPKNLMQIIVVDSNSSDQTISLVNSFIKQHPEMMIEILIETERKGKSAALNQALRKCEGDAVIVSDADCFWPSDILNRTLPFLSDPNIGAVSGPKILLNPKQSWVTKTEDSYLNSMNLMRLGESKIGSTLWFEGGFSAYKKDVIEAFDPYGTGSDDCGTIINVIEKSFRAISVPEGRFFTTCPVTWTERIRMKARRANQLVRVFGRYTALLGARRLENSKRAILRSILIYVLSPIMFILLLINTIPLLLNFPYFLVILAVLLVPKIRFYLFEAIQSYFLLFLTIFSIALGKKFSVWKKPKNRSWLTEDVLAEHMLV